MLRGTRDGRICGLLRSSLLGLMLLVEFVGSLIEKLNSLTHDCILGNQLTALRVHAVGVVATHS